VESERKGGKVRMEEKGLKEGGKNENKWWKGRGEDEETG
jgi:hypothetical protein